MKSTFFPHFTIGVDAYDAIPDICLDYGKTAVIVGGEKSRAAAEPLIRKAIEGKIEILGSFQSGRSGINLSQKERKLIMCGRSVDLLLK